MAHSTCEGKICDTASPVTGIHCGWRMEENGGLGWGREDGIAVRDVKAGLGNSNDNKCPECLCDFATHGSMMRHKKTVHDKVKSHQCDLCEKCYTQASSLKAHRLQHKDKKPWKCWCGKAYSESMTLKYHQKMKHDNGEAIGIKHPCDICGKEFRHMSAVKAHKQKVHTANRECEQCEEAFKTSSELRRHMLDDHSSTDVTKHHIARWDRALGICNEEEVTAYQSNKCNQCDEVLKTIEELGRHILDQHPGTDVSKDQIVGWDQHIQMNKSDGRDLNCDVKAEFLHFTNLTGRLNEFKKESKEDPDKVQNQDDQELNHVGDIHDGCEKPSCDASFDHDDTLGGKDSDMEVKDEEEVKMEVEDGDVEDCLNDFINAPIFLAKANENGLFPCDECDMICLNNNEQKEHKLVQHEGLRYECCKCDNIFMNQREMKVHKAGCTVSPKKIEQSQPDLLCCDCSFRTNRADRLKDHMLVEHDGRRHCCNSCSATFAQLRNLQAHVRQVHDKEPLLCDKCDYRTTRKDSLRMHKQSKHEGIEYKCDQCMSSYNREKDLGRHKVAQHSGTRFKCGFCDYTANLADKIKSHTMIHHGKNHLKAVGTRFFCHACESSYSANKDLQEHIQIKHLGVLFECDDCEKSYNSKKELSRHVKAKHELLKYYCEKCGHESQSQRELSRHKKIRHEGAKGSFLCDKCDYVAGYQSVLNTHKQAKHEGVKLTCSLCSHTSNSDVSLRMHFRSKHQGQ